MSIGATLPPKSPLEFEGRNIRTPKRSGATNDLYLVQFEITREAWESLETVPKNALLEGIIWYHDGDSEDAPIDLNIKKPRKKDLIPKGPHGTYWNRMHVRGVLHNHDLAEALRLEGADFPDDGNHIEVALRARFEVSSKTFIHPDDFEQFLEGHNLVNLVTLSRQERAKLAERGSGG